MFPALPLPLLTRSRVALAWALGAVVAWMGAAVSSAAESTAKPTDLIAAEAGATAGLGKLTAAQRDELDRLIQRELTLAREGDVRGFAGTFSTRRTAAERAAAGLEGLEPAELAKLDLMVARLLETPAPTTWPVRLPRSSSVANAEVQPVGDRLKVHGHVSATYGWGGGGSFYGGSLGTSVYDPVTGTSLYLGLSDYRGDGLRRYGPYRGGRR